MVQLIARMTYEKGKMWALSTSEGAVFTLPANIGDLDPGITQLDLSQGSLTGAVRVQLSVRVMSNHHRHRIAVRSVE